MISGYHSKATNKCRVFRNLRGPNKFGVYEQEILANGLRKKSTFFPDAWDLKTSMKKLDEAGRVENRVHFDKNGFIGTTKEGLLIQYWYVLDKESGEETVLAHPYVEETLAEVLQRPDVQSRIAAGRAQQGACNVE